MKTKFFLLFLFFSFQSLFCEYEWKEWGTLNDGRYAFQALPISDHEILVMGGQNTSSALNSCEIINTSDSTVYYARSMNTKRSQFVALLTKDSNVVVLGGVVELDFDATDIVEIFDRNTRKWSILGTMTMPRFQFTAQFTNDDEIFIMGSRVDGGATNSCEIFNIKTGTTRAARDLPYSWSNLHSGVTSTKDLLVFAGRSGGSDSFRSKNIYKFDEALVSWDILSQFSRAVQNVSVYKHLDGKLFISGGALKDEGTYDCVGSDEINIIDGGACSTPYKMLFPRQCHEMAALNKDTIIIAGGVCQANRNTCEFFSLIDHESSFLKPMNKGRFLFSLISMKSPKHRNKTIYAIGGAGGGQNSIEVLESPEENILNCGPGSFEVANFSNLNLFNTIGDAASENGKLELTKLETYSKGALWTKNKMDVGRGFVSTFSFRFANGYCNDPHDITNPGADGLAFVIQNSTFDAIGTTGGGLGYHGIPNSLAVEFDTYKNTYDSSEFHVAIQTNNQSQNTSQHSPSSTLAITENVPSMKADGTIYYAKVEYNYTDKNRLKVYLGTDMNFSQPILDVYYVFLENILTLDGKAAAYVGFTSSTGLCYEKNTLLDWSLCISKNSINDVADQKLSTSNDVNVYPNPSSETTNFDFFLDNPSDVTLCVFDKLGVNVQTIYSGYQNAGPFSVSCDGSSLSSGVYFYRLITNNLIKSGCFSIIKD